MSTLNFLENEVRVLGCLLEKQLATPDYYPMTLNSLVMAANQKSSRDPVLSLSEEEVDEAAKELCRKEFVEQVRISGARAFKFRQRLDQRWSIGDVGAESERDILAVLAVLFLRGAQTVGQIRTRTERMFHFPDLNTVQAILKSLMEETEQRPALVVEDHTQPGREVRYIHLLCQTSQSSLPSVGGSAEEKATLPTGFEERLNALEERVLQLEEQLNKKD